MRIHFTRRLTRGVEREVFGDPGVLLENRRQGDVPYSGDEPGAEAGEDHLPRLLPIHEQQRRDDAAADEHRHEHHVEAEQRGGQERRTHVDEEPSLAVEAHLMAVQSLFLSLDAEDLPAAHTWLNRALKTIAYSPGEERVRALVFGQARLAIQEGKFSEVEKLYADIDLGADEAYMPRRYALDTSCIALALSKIGDVTRAAALARQKIKCSSF